MNPILDHAISAGCVVGAAAFAWGIGRMQGQTAMRERFTAALEREQRLMEGAVSQNYDHPGIKSILRFNLIQCLKRMADAMRDEKLPK